MGNDFKMPHYALLKKILPGGSASAIILNAGCTRKIFDFSIKSTPNLLASLSYLFDSSSLVPSWSWRSRSWISLKSRYNIDYIKYMNCQKLFLNRLNIIKTNLCKIDSVEECNRWRPSRTANFPSMAATTNGLNFQTVSPFDSVVLCWIKSLAVKS